MDFPVNLMFLAGLPREDWRKHIFHRLEEISSPAKALVPWAAAWRGRVEVVRLGVARKMSLADIGVCAKKELLQEVLPFG